MLSSLPRLLRCCRLSILWQDIAADFARFGYFFRDNAGTLQRQGGVFRTNCVDTLDRTNVVQVTCCVVVGFCAVVCV